MITYNDIYELLRKERYSEQLQPIGKKFISDVSSYISEKKKIANQQSEMFSDEIVKVKKQIENSMAIFNELMLLRKKKLLNLVFVASETGISKRDFENMLDFEKEMFDKVIASVKESEKAINSQFNYNGVLELSNLKLIHFLENVDEFLGLKGESQGPFNKGDISNVDSKIADILIEDKKAEIVVED
ncbi:MAG: hypothetical protein WC533_04520 [Candidatus Pacearchaeota archaeon]